DGSSTARFVAHQGFWSHWDRVLNSYAHQAVHTSLKLVVVCLPRVPIYGNLEEEHQPGTSSCVRETHELVMLQPQPRSAPATTVRPYTLQNASSVPLTAGGIRPAVEVPRSHCTGSCHSEK